MKISLGFIIAICLVGIGCLCRYLDNDAHSPAKCRQHVQREYPHAVIWSVPGRNHYQFIVVDSNHVYSVQCMSGTTTDITDRDTIK